MFGQKSKVAPERNSNYGKIQLEKVMLSYSNSNQKVLNNFSVSINSGEFVSVLGVSGVGKTTLLRVIAGFEMIEEGYVRINGLLASSTFIHVPPEKRKLGFVFQDYALFPHMNVLDNIGYGISKRNSNRDSKIRQIIELIDLKGHEKKIPGQLSGGQQQRVALGRALAIEPSAILMDEPFSNLDYQLRDSLSKKLKQIIKESKTTVILVTHNQFEAHKLSDKCFLMENGRIKD